MRTTLVIDDDLLREARDLLGTESIRDTVAQALREGIRSRRRQQLLSLMRTMELDLAPTDLEQWRRAEPPLPD